MGKRRIFTFIAFLSLSVFSTLSFASDQTKLQQATRTLAAISAARGVIDGMNNYDYPGLIGETKKVILDDTKTHSQRVQSEQALRKIYGSKFDGIFENNLYEILNKLDLDVPQKEFKELIYDKYHTTITSNKKNFLENKGKKAFKKGRELAVRDQQDKITMNSYPDKEIVEDLQVISWPENQVNERKRIHKLKMAKAVTATGEALLQEVSENLDQKIDEIFLHAKEQIEDQFEQLKTEPDKRLITSKQIADFWRQRVQNKIKQMGGRKKPGQMIYPETFSSVISKITTLSNQLEGSRFKNFIKKTDLKISNSNQLIGIIEKDTNSHKSFNNSESLIVNSVFKSATNKFVDTYAKQAPESQRQGFHNRLVSQHLNDVENDLREKILELIKPDLKEARNIISKKQIETYFPTLANQSLSLEGEHEVIIERIKGVGEKIDIASFADLTEQPIIGALTKRPVETGKLLAETESLALNKFIDIKKEAERAWDGQEEIYVAFEAYMKKASKRIYIKDVLKAKMEKKIEPINPLPPELSKCLDGIKGSLKERTDVLVHCFISEIDRIWKANRKFIIWGHKAPSVSTKYVNLFEYLKKQIEYKLKRDIGKVLGKLEKERQEALEKQQEEARKRQEALEKQQEEARKRQEALEKQQEEARKRQEALEKQQEEARKRQEALEKQQEEARTRRGLGKNDAPPKIQPTTLNNKVYENSVDSKSKEEGTVESSKKSEKKKQNILQSIITFLKKNILQFIIVILIVLILLLVAYIVYGYSTIPDYENSSIRFSRSEKGISIYQWANLELLIEESSDPAQRKIRVRKVQ